MSATIFRKWVKVIALSGFMLMNAFGQSDNYKANQKSIVLAGRARFTVLTPRLIRLEWSRDGRFIDQPSIVFINRRLPVPPFHVQKEGEFLILETQFLTLKYRHNSGRFTPRNLSIAYHDKDTTFTWHPGMPNIRNLKGTAYSLDDHNGRFHRDTAKPLQLMDGLISRDGWVVIDDSHTALLDDSEWRWLLPRAQDEEQDWYFLGYGNQFKAALHNFIQVAGQPPLPPRFVFGVWWSRYWEYTDQELRQLVKDYRDYRLPLNVLMVDMDWHITSLPEFFENGKRKHVPGGKKMGWTGFTWNRNYFPEPEEFLSWMHAHHIRVGLNLHLDAGILPHEARYAQLARALGLNPASRQPIPFKLFDQSFMKKFFTNILDPMQQQGVDFWWLDWQNWNPGPVPGVNTQYWLNYVFFSHAEKQNKRGLILSRYAGLGSHRFPVGFSGDASISWKSLDFQPYFTATAANVIYGYWSHDIGGHTRGDSPPELYTRWVQFGVLSPVFRTHATKSENIERSFWAYPLPYFRAMQKAVQLRARLFPYIYTAAFNAYKNGVVICHPLYYEYPRQPEAYRFGNEYFFGNRILVHPITHPIGKDSLFTYQLVWLPPGEGWIEWLTGSVFKGNRILKRPFMLDEIPFYVKAGAIIPEQPFPEGRDALNSNRLILTIFPGGTDQIDIYEDDGITQDYQKGVYTLTPVRSYAIKSGMEVEIGPVKGAFPGMPESRSYEIRLPLSFPPRAVLINGKTAPYKRYGGKSCWTYDGDTFETRIFTSSVNVQHTLQIQVFFSRSDWWTLSGVPARIKRLKHFARFLAARGWDRSRYSNDLIVRNAQLGLRISQHPERIETLLEQFRQEWPRILTMLSEVNARRPEFRPYYQLLKVSQRIEEGR